MLVVGCHSVNGRHEVFDEYGKVVFSQVDKLGRRAPRPHDVKRFYSASSGDRLYKLNDDDTGYCVYICVCVCVLYCVLYYVHASVCVHGILYNLIFLDRLTSTIECLRLPSVDQSPDTSIIMFGTQPHIHTLPGCIIIHTTAGIYTLDPVTLTPMPCKMVQTRGSNSHSEDDGIPRPQFDVANCTVTILSVFNINWSSNKKKQDIDNDGKPLPEFPDSMGSTTLVTKATVEDSQSESSITNSCCVAMAINSRLIVMKVTGW